MHDRPTGRARELALRLIGATRDGRAAGLTLTVATVAALLWANLAADSYRHFWLHTLAVPGLRLSVREWVDQGLMVAFFVAVGLEIRREISGGELRSWRLAATPVVAALGGMAVPALVYVGVVHGGAGARGWGIPMATDVAFALGALALLATHASARLRVFLLTLAVADDIASIAVLVCFYSRDVRLWVLVAASTCLGAMFAVHATRARSTAVLAALAVLAWWALVHAGVEACVVGVVVGLLGPAAAGPDRDRQAERHRVRAWEHALEPWVNALVLPVFALANVGVTLAGSKIFSHDAFIVFVAVVVARVIGKPLGIAGTTWAMTRGGDAATHDRARDRMHLRPRDRVGIGALAGVGFTVPLLIVHAALPAGPLASSAIAGLLVGSVLGAVIGAVVLRGAPGPGPTTGLDRDAG